MSCPGLIYTILFIFIILTVNIFLLGGQCRHSLKQFNCRFHLHNLIHQVWYHMVPYLWLSFHWKKNSTPYKYSEQIYESKGLPQLAASLIIAVPISTVYKNEQNSCINHHCCIDIKVYRIQQNRLSVIVLTVAAL